MDCTNILNEIIAYSSALWKVLQISRFMTTLFLYSNLMASKCPTFILSLSIVSAYQTIHGSMFNCHGYESCKRNILTCDSSEDCNISCGAVSACKHSTILCPTNATCQIDCLSYQNVCENITIKAISSTDLTLNCPAIANHDHTNGCDQSSIYCLVILF